jgi:hypothetical protein
MLDEDARETEVKAIEAYLPPGQVAFTMHETAKILRRSVRWTRQKTADGKLKAVPMGKLKCVLRPEIVRALTEGVEQ